ncbi:MAG: hypothetical protein HC933_01035 [Pleurocapsa sp. SU_196_0]|nr:hypothetical protein [Pleurocapsa sp. SU_196_0]
MRLVLGLIALGFVMGCGRTYDVSVATDPRILRGAWQGRLDAICQARGSEYTLHPNGATLVENLEPSLWNVTTRQRIARLEVAAETFVTDLRWTADGNLVGAVLGTPGTTRVQRWNGVTGAVVGAPKTLPSGAYRLSQDGRRVATAVWSPATQTETGLIITNLETDATTTIALEPYAVEFGTRFLGFSSDDAFIVRVSERRVTLETTSQAVQVWRSSDGALISSSVQSFDYRTVPRAFTLEQTSLWMLSGTTLKRLELTSGSVSQTENFTSSNTAARLEVSPDGSALAVVTPEVIDLYSSTDLTQRSRRIATGSYLVQNALSWIRDSSRVIFPTQTNSQPVGLYGGVGIQCGFASEGLAGQDRIDFEQQGAERLDASVDFTATFQNERQYSVGGTALLSGHRLEVRGMVEAGTNERLHVQTPAMFPPVAKLEFKGVEGERQWESGADAGYSVLLTEPQSSLAPFARGVMVRVSDNKQFLLQLERTP